MTTTINASTSSGLVQTADTSGVLQLQTANTAAVTINGSQLVGIGTNNPQYSLDVQAASGSQIGRFKATTTTNESYLTIANSGVMYIGLDNSTGSAITNTAYAPFIYSSTNTPMYFFTNGVKQLNIDTSGNINFNNSNSGIKFNNTSALTNSTLNDYETGTWTPSLTFVTGGSTGITYGSRSATYTKIGDTVYIAMDFSLSSKGSATGSAYITGLPFTVSSAVSNVMVMPCLLGNASSLPSTLVAGALGTSIYLYYTYASGYTNLQNTTFNNNSGVTICGSYKATF